MATAKIHILAPGLTTEELNERIMGKGMEMESIFAVIFKDDESWSVRYQDDIHGLAVPKTYANDHEK